MQYQVSFLSFLFLLSCGAAKDSPMTDMPLSVQVKCRDQDSCLFDGKDLFIDIEVTNKGAGQIEFPLAFMQQRGPVVRLIDTRTGADTFLRSNPADFSMLEQYTPIPVGHLIVLNWVIMAQELRQFGGQSVDLSAVVTVMVPIRMNGEKIECQASGSIRILDKNRN